MEEAPERKPPGGSSTVDELLSRTRHFLAGMIADFLKRPLDDLLQWMLARTMRALLATALFIMAAVFLLLGGAEGLVASGVPPYAAHLATGGASLVAALIVLKCCCPPSARK